MAPALAMTIPGQLNIPPSQNTEAIHAVVTVMLVILVVVFAGMWMQSESNNATATDDLEAARAEEGNEMANLDTPTLELAFAEERAKNLNLERRLREARMREEACFNVAAHSGPFRTENAERSAIVGLRKRAVTLGANALSAWKTTNDKQKDVVEKKNNTDAESLTAKRNWRTVFNKVKELAKVRRASTPEGACPVTKDSTSKLDKCDHALFGGREIFGSHSIAECADDFTIGSDDGSDSDVSHGRANGRVNRRVNVLEADPRIAGLEEHDVVIEGGSDDGASNKSEGTGASWSTTARAIASEMPLPHEEGSLESLKDPEDFENVDLETDDEQPRGRSRTRS